VKYILSDKPIGLKTSVECYPFLAVLRNQTLAYVFIMSVSISTFGSVSRKL